MLRDPDCPRSEALLHRLQADQELTAGDLDHVGTCPDCGELVDLHDRLGGLAAPEPEESDLEELRRRVAREVGARGRRPRARAPLGGSLAWLSSPAWAAGAAIACVAVGFLAGSLGREPAAGPAADASAGREGGLERDLQLAARSNRELAETRRSPYVYSDVRLEEVGPDTVRLSFDVATHVELERPRTDPLVSEVLVQSIVGSEPLDERLDAVEQVPVLSGKVRDALVVALLEDPDLAVRLKALEKLAVLERDAPTRDALLRVLEQEDSVPLRLLAIDALTSRRIEPGALASAVEHGRPEPGTAIRSRLGSYLATFDGQAPDIPETEGDT